ncbi:MAG TPA: mechanosensitive ion channel family protein [Streptosporangiaceae bacterium]
MSSHDLLLAAHAASSQAAATLEKACGKQPGIACRVVWDITHSSTAATTTTVFIAGPAALIIRIGYVLLLAILIRYAVHRVIRRITRRATEEGSGGDRARVLFRERRQQRAAALGSVLENAASLTIFGIAAITVLGDIGINLAPVLASAGVLGIAIGFGAQGLMQDFLAGIFMLMEDQYGVGDVVRIGDVSGVVEGVSLRITRVRDVGGVVWHIRNGTISQAGNGSQGWARAVVDVPLPYDEDIPDIPRARAVLSGAAAGMWQEAAWREAILEEPEVWGVQDLARDAVTVRVAARTVPLRQSEVERELRERLMTALAGPAGREPARAPV